MHSSDGTDRRHTRRGTRFPRASLALIAAVMAPATLARADDPGQYVIPEDSPVADALRRAEQAVSAIVSIPSGDQTYETTVDVIDDLKAQLEIDTNMMRFMAYVSTDPAQRALGQRAEQDVENWLIDFHQRESVLGAIMAASYTSPRAQGEQQRLIEHTLRDYQRAGMRLPPEKRQRLTTVKMELNRLAIEFDHNINQDETTVPLTREELGGMPDDFFQQDIERSGDLYLVSMDYPQFLPIMDFCDNQTTRKKVWVAYKRRGGQRNIEVLEQILELRAEAADLLGYDHAADFEIEVRMAKDADTVLEFYQRLRPLVRRKAELDWAEFVEAKRAHTGDPEATLYPWDFSFYQTLLKKEKYAVDANRVKEYFPMERVMDGLFSITQSLYGLEYRDVTDEAESRGRPIWHESVQLFEVVDTARGEVLGEFYLDLHPRANKYGHAAQWGLAQHKVWSDGRVTKPLAALVCNFPEPTPGKPALLSHDEVETFFHEFGHCLHTIVSEAKYWRFAGTGVERDFVEAPSQMFENWVWDAGVLNTFAAHYETGEPLPTRLLEGMIKARHLGSGMLAEHQFYYGLVDLTYHLDPEGDADTTKVANDLFPEIELYAAVPGVHFQSAFGHLTGYQAGYYGYQWSLVYACDMFQRFKELGMLDTEAGRYYREKILAAGGTRDGMDLVRDFLGREPDLSAYLAHLGLEEE